MTIVHNADMPDVEQPRNDFAALMKALEAAEKDGDFPRAVILGSEALSLEPRHINLRCHLGLLLVQHEKAHDAISLFEQGLKAQPESISLALGLAGALAAAGRYGKAIAVARDLIWPCRGDEAFRSAYASWLVKAGSDPSIFSDVSGVDGNLKLLKDLWAELHANEQAIDAEKIADLKAKANNEEASPPDAAYLRGLFDYYAEGFDEHLKMLGYSVPSMLKAAIDRVLPERNDLDIVDLGCGTGLGGEVFKPLARHLTGVDLSKRMLLPAKSRHIYDRLEEGDMIAVLRDLPPPYDVVLASDVLVYLADFTELFQEVRRVLRPKGCLAANVETSSDPNRPHELKKSRRFGHSEIYLRQTAEKAGLKVVFLEAFTARREQQQEVVSIAFVLQKP